MNDLRRKHRRDERVPFLRLLFCALCYVRLFYIMYKEKETTQRKRRQQGSYRASKITRSPPLRPFIPYFVKVACIHDAYRDSQTYPRTHADRGMASFPQACRTSRFHIASLNGSA